MQPLDPLPVESHSRDSGCWAIIERTRHVVFMTCRVVHYQTAVHCPSSFPLTHGCPELVYPSPTLFPAAGSSAPCLPSLRKVGSLLPFKVVSSWCTPPHSHSGQSGVGFRRTHFCSVRPCGVKTPTPSRPVDAQAMKILWSIAVFCAGLEV